VEDPVECERQLDDAEVGTEMATVLGDRVDDELAHLDGQGGQLVPVERLDVVRRGDRLEDHEEVDCSGESCGERRAPSPSADERSGQRTNGLAAGAISRGIFTTGFRLPAGRADVSCGVISSPVANRARPATRARPAR
jgi:hypothetical protein